MILFSYTKMERWRTIRMEIGKTLKHFRTSKKLRQIDFVNGVISVPFYSKVEHGEHRISAEDLFKILSHNEITIEAFMKELALNEVADREAQLRSDMYRYFYDRNTVSLTKMLKDIEDMSLLNKPLWRAQLKVNIANLEGRFAELEQVEIDLIYKEMLSIDPWNTYTLSLFANTLYLFDFDNVTFFIKSILRPKTLQKLDKDSRSKQIILTICLNYIALCIERHKEEYTKLPLQILREAPHIPELFFYKVMALFYGAILQGSNKDENAEIQIKMLVHLFNSVNMPGFSEAILQYYNNHQHE